MIFAEILLILVGGFLGAAVICAMVAFAIYKMMGEEDDGRAEW